MRGRLSAGCASRRASSRLNASARSGFSLSAGMILATGSPREVTSTVSPARTSRRIFEKCRFASAAETVFMASVVPGSIVVKLVPRPGNAEILQRSSPKVGEQLLLRRLLLGRRAARRLDLDDRLATRGDDHSLAGAHVAQDLGEMPVGFGGGDGLHGVARRKVVIFTT